MNKKILSDLEKMVEERAKAEEEYIEENEEVTEVFRLMREGITNVDELITYLAVCIRDAKHMEDVARVSNNNIMYSEAIAVRREFSKLMELVLIDTTAFPMEEQDGTEEAHRTNNEGEEAYQ